MKVMTQLCAIAGISLLSAFAQAQILPGNVLSNPDIESQAGTSNFPLNWFHSALGDDWNTDQFVSPTHSLHINDTSTTDASDWRSAGVLIPAGTNQIVLQWHWLYKNISGEFFVTLRFFEGVDSNGNTSGTFFGEDNTATGQGDNPGWEQVTKIFTVPPGAGSFDVVIRSISGNGTGGTGATGELWADDISATLGVYGDTDGNGCVDDFDLTNVILDFGGPPIHGNTDITGPTGAPDGIVDDFDLTAVILNFGFGCP